MNTTQATDTTQSPTLTWVSVSLIVASASGLATWLTGSHASWAQWNVLLHLLTGIALTLAMLPYLVTHFRRAVGARRPSILISGVLNAALFGVFAGTGWWIMLQGQRESQTWVYDWHWIGSLAFLALLAVHLVSHRLTLPRRRLEHGGAFHSKPAYFWTLSVVVSSLLLATPPLAAWLYDSQLQPYSTDPAVADYLYNYGPHPFRPSQTESPGSTFVDKRQVGRSERCVSCHMDVSRQWFASIHRQAADDPTYVSNVNLLEKKRGISATRYCEGCHAPIALLSGELSPGGKHGGVPGTMANLEGVSCLSCHAIGSLVHHKGVASFRFEPATDYLFAQAEHPLLQRLHDWLLRVRPDQHVRDMGRPISRESRFCAACHTQFMDKEMNDWGWIKMQDEYSAWLASPYSKQHQESFSADAATRCQDCHMPMVPSDDPSANKDGLVRAHHFPGSNTFVPLIRGDNAQLQATRTFLQSNKMRISIDKPHRQDAVQTLHALDERLRREEDAPYYYYLGEQARIQLAVSNQGVGHDFPGGTTDINEAWLEFLVLDAEGREVFANGRLQEDGHLSPDAYFYGSIPVDRHGARVWKHDLFQMVGESYRRTVPAGQSDVVEYRFEVPSWAKSPLTVTATLKYRKLNQRYALWALKEQYTEIPAIEMAWDSLSIPLKIRREVETGAADTTPAPEVATAESLKYR